MNTLVYDLETLNARQPSDAADRLPGISYADCSRDEYWKRHDLVGISVICAYASWLDRYFAFSDHVPCEAAHVLDIEPLSGFRELVGGAQLFVNFNGGAASHLGFDNVVLRANEMALPQRAYYDLLVEGWIAQGLNPLIYDPSTHGGGLGDYARENLGMDKSLDGESAPVAWQLGKYHQVWSYCMLDVRLTWKLFKLSQKLGHLHNPITDRLVKFRQIDEH